jgi:hypothetical protein
MKAFFSPRRVFLSVKAFFCPRLTFYPADKKNAVNEKTQAVHAPFNLMTHTWFGKNNLNKKLKISSKIFQF